VNSFLTAHLYKGLFTTVGWWTISVYNQHQGQLSLPSLQGRSVEYRPIWLVLRRGVFTCVG